MLLIPYSVWFLIFKISISNFGATIGTGYNAFDRLTPYEKKVIEDLLSYLKRLEFVEALFLYGSRSSGRSNEWSDMDVAVIVKNRNYVRVTEKLIEKWNIESLPEIMLHVIVINQDDLKNTVIGKEITKGKPLWLRHPRT